MNEFEKELSAKVEKELLDKLKIAGFINKKPVVKDRTIKDIKQFKKFIHGDKECLKKEKIVSMKKSLNRLMHSVDKKEFIIFYNHFFNDVSKSACAAEMLINVSTVCRKLNKCINIVSIYLYPDEYIIENDLV